MKKIIPLLFLIGIIAVSCKKENPVDKTTFRQALVLGNSITIHPPLPSIGWFGNWGMAASSKDKDFVIFCLHRLMFPWRL